MKGCNFPIFEFKEGEFSFFYAQPDWLSSKNAKLCVNRQELRKNKIKCNNWHHGGLPENSTVE